MTNEVGTTRAAVVTGYSPPTVVAVQEPRRPQPGPRDLLLRVEATSVSSGDVRARARRVPAGMDFLMRLAMPRERSSAEQ